MVIVLRVRKKGSFGKRGLFGGIHFLDLESSGSRKSKGPPDSGKARRIRPSSIESGKFRGFRGSRDSSSEKTPFVVTPFSGPEVLLRSRCNDQNVPKEQRRRHLEKPLSRTVLLGGSASCSFPLQVCSRTLETPGRNSSSWWGVLPSIFTQLDDRFSK